MATETSFPVSRTKNPPHHDPGNGLDALRKRASHRVTERIDLANSRHKPASLLKQDAKRVLEQFFDIEAANLTRSDRDKLTEEIFCELFGYGPLEELFRDEKIVEFMILSHDQIISRDRDFWMPVNTRFRDREHYAGMLERIRSQSESIFVSETNKLAAPAAFDVKLPNGFRMVGVCPPSVLEQSGLTVFVRGTATNKLNSGLAPKATAPDRSINSTPAPMRNPPARPVEKSANASIDFNATAKLSGSSSGNTTLRIVDPYERYRIRITERLILRLATAGVYDLSTLPINELRRAIAMYVQEFNAEETLGLSTSDEDRLTLEILNSMNRKS